MPSGPKKRRAARKKEGLGGILAANEDSKSQDATGTISTQPVEGDKPAEAETEVILRDTHDELVQKEEVDSEVVVQPDTLFSQHKEEGHEVNLLVPDFGENGNQVISVEGFSKMANPDPSNKVTEAFSDDVLEDILMTLDLLEGTVRMAKRNPALRVCPEFPKPDEELRGCVVADNLIDQESTSEVCTENYSLDFPVNKVSAVPLVENEENQIPNAASLMPVKPDQENEVPIDDAYSYAKGDILEGHKNQVEMKVKLKSINEAIWKTKKIVEEQLKALSKFREVLLESLDGLNAIQQAS